MTEIGDTLREARMRSHIDVSEIEASTKIRAKYLRALENEEWGLLPGPTFVKSFLRTYAQALGLDGKALVEEYRLNHEHPSEAALEPIVSSTQSARTRGAGPRRTPTGPSRAYMALVGAVLLLIVLLVVGLLSGGGGGGSGTPKVTGATGAATAAHRTAHTRRHLTGTSTSASSTAALVTLSLRASARVYVCLIGDSGRKLIAGSELQAGSNTPTFHAKRFEITLGNNSVVMVVDGQPRTVPPSSEAIGYSLTKASGRRPLAPSRLPTCL
jgi:cytoskeleton protein RodZ